MVLKRKRSDSEIGSVFSSTEKLGSHCFNFDSVSAMDTARRGFFAPRLSAPSHLPSRTMKRFRDNRPSETEVHQHTLDVLFSAQRRPHERHYTPPESPKTASAGGSLHMPTQTHHISQQRSLHSFWSLPGPASSPSSSDVSLPSTSLVPRSTSTNCEDCGVGLAGGDDDDVMMDIEGGYGSSPEDQTCGACGKTVCFSCSISNLGENRRCLVCAGPRGRVDGAEWSRR